MVKKQEPVIPIRGWSFFGEHAQALKLTFCYYHKLSVTWDAFLIIRIFMGSGWPMFSENTLMLYQQNLKLRPYFVKWQQAIDQGLPTRS